MLLARDESSAWQNHLSLQGNREVPEVFRPIAQQKGTIAIAYVGGAQQLGLQARSERAAKRR